MALVPDTRLGKIEFSEAHLAPFAANAVAIGTTTTAVTDLTTKTTAARAAYAAWLAAQNSSKAALDDYYMAVTTMSSALSDIIKQVRTKAAIAGDGVYTLAEIPVPATPTPVGPPGTPGDFKVVLQPTGAVELTWKCANPAGSVGTIYNVYRAAAGSDDFQYLGGSGTKKFVDFSLPSGVASVRYQIQAVRSTAVGVANIFLVQFGVSSGGGMTATVVEGARSGPTPPAKIAA